MNDEELINPKRILWLNERLPIYLKRFFDDEWNAVAEHVYVPTGRMSFTREHGRSYEFEYQRTRRLKVPDLRG